MAINQARNKVLAVDDDEVWRGIIERAVKRLDPSIEIQLETTRETALATISQDAEKLLAVLTDNHLKGETGASGKEIAIHARDAGIPNIAILTGRPAEIVPLDGIAVWSKTDGLALIVEKLKKVLQPVECPK